MKLMLAAIAVSGMLSGCTSMDDNPVEPKPSEKPKKVLKSYEMYSNATLDMSAEITYDKQGRVTGVYNKYSLDDGYSTEYVIYNYESNKIIETSTFSNTIRTYLLNDAGVVEKMTTDSYDGSIDLNVVDEYTYDSDNRMLAKNSLTDKIHKFYWSDDEMTRYEIGDQAVYEYYVNITPSEVSTDNYILPYTPFESMNSIVYMMGYFGKPSKHLPAQKYTKAQSSLARSEVTEKFTYTVTDGYVTKIVHDSDFTMVTPEQSFIRNNKREYVFHWEEL